MKWRKSLAANTFGLQENKSILQRNKGKTRVKCSSLKLKAREFLDSHLPGLRLLSARTRTHDELVTQTTWNFLEVLRRRKNDSEILPYNTLYLSFFTCSAWQNLQDSASSNRFFGRDGDSGTAGVQSVNGNISTNSIFKIYFWNAIKEVSCSIRLNPERIKRSQCRWETFCQTPVLRFSGIIFIDVTESWCSLTRHMHHWAAAEKQTSLGFFFLLKKTNVFCYLWRKYFSVFSPLIWWELFVLQLCVNCWVCWRVKGVVLLICLLLVLITDAQKILTFYFVLKHRFILGFYFLTQARVFGAVKLVY